MFTKKMIQSIIDFVGTEYHKKLTNKEWDNFIIKIQSLREEKQ